MGVGVHCPEAGLHVKPNSPRLDLFETKRKGLRAKPTFWKKKVDQLNREELPEVVANQLESKATAHVTVEKLSKRWRIETTGHRYCLDLAAKAAKFEGGSGVDITGVDTQIPLYLYGNTRSNSSLRIEHDSTAAALHVKQEGAGLAARFEGHVGIGTSPSTSVFFTDGKGNLIIKTPTWGSTKRGNVGIGTDDPQARLHVKQEKGTALAARFEGPVDVKGTVHSNHHYTTWTFGLQREFGRFAPPIDWITILSKTWKPILVNAQSSRPTHMLLLADFDVIMHCKIRVMVNKKEEAKTDSRSFEERVSASMHIVKEITGNAEIEVQWRPYIRYDGQIKAGRVSIIQL